MQNYSPLFHTLHDETSPIGVLGRGTHYSVLSAVQWVDKRKKLLHVPCTQRFAIIWDDDHDERIIDVIERAYMSGIFAPVLCVGERKGMLSILVDREFYEHIGGDWASYHMAWSEICTNVCEDVWSFQQIEVIDGPTGIIADDEAKVQTYLANIRNLWSLGLNPYRHPRVKDYVPFPIRQGGVFGSLQGWPLQN